MESIDEKNRDCLVAVVKSDADLRRFADEGWYRIPGRAVGRALAAGTIEESKVLALYQTASIGCGLPSAIELWGEIEERRILPRRMIVPEEPLHPSADEEYHMIRVRAIERLASPIVSRRPRRVTFLRTTSERLFHASDINDLIVGARGEEALWRSLRDEDVEIERKYFMRVHDVVMEVDFALFQSQRTLGILCDGERLIQGDPDIEAPSAWSLLRFSPAQLESSLSICLTEIAESLARMREKL